MFLTEQDEINNRQRACFSKLLGASEEAKNQDMAYCHICRKKIRKWHHQRMNDNSIERDGDKNSGNDEIPPEILNVGKEMIGWLHRMFSGAGK